MRDEIFHRTYQTGRVELNAGIDRLINRIARSVNGAFEAAHRVQFDAPWSRQTRDARRA